MRITIKMFFSGIIPLLFGLSSTAQSDLASVNSRNGMATDVENVHLQKRTASYLTNGAVDQEEDAIRKVLLDYIEGTADGAPERIRRAFHQDLNLYSVADHSLKVLPGREYISYFKSGEKKDRIGKIIFIDYVNDAATAKIEVKMPGSKRLYTDYLLLLKIDDVWKIIHKSFTFEALK